MSVNAELLEAARIGVQLTQMLLRDTNSRLLPPHQERLEKARAAIIRASTEAPR